MEVRYLLRGTVCVEIWLWHPFYTPYPRYRINFCCLTSLNMAYRFGATTYDLVGSETFLDLSTYMV